MAIIKLEKGRPVDSTIINNNFIELVNKVDTETDKMDTKVEATKTMVNDSVETLLGFKVLDGEIISVTDNETQNEVKELLGNQSLVKHLLDLRYHRNSNCKYVKAILPDETLRNLETVGAVTKEHNYFTYTKNPSKAGNVAVTTDKTIAKGEYSYSYKELIGVLTEDEENTKNSLVEKELNLFIPCGVNSVMTKINYYSIFVDVELPDGITFKNYSVLSSFILRKNNIVIGSSQYVTDIGFIDVYGIENNKLKLGLKLYFPKVIKPKNSDGTYSTGEFDINLTIRGI